ncbi:hypothetical protein BKA69DRAFT_1125704 [Paraphysoderma sedebokerense]|nr:hypothetical protein BKA69DRAFT_1125704 [Paraphysoderma sedebokerense]
MDKQNRLTRRSSVRKSRRPSGGASGIGIIAEGNSNSDSINNSTMSLEASRSSLERSWNVGSRNGSNSRASSGRDENGDSNGGSSDLLKIKATSLRPSYSVSSHLGGRRTSEPTSVLHTIEANAHQRAKTISVIPEVKESTEKKGGIVEAIKQQQQSRKSFEDEILENLKNTDAFQLLLASSRSPSTNDLPDKPAVHRGGKVAELVGRLNLNADQLQQHGSHFSRRRGDSITRADGFRIEETSADYFSEPTASTVDQLSSSGSSGSWDRDYGSKNVAAELRETFLNLVKSNYHEYVMEHVDVLSLYYREHFFQRDHNNYIGIMEVIGPVVISVAREPVDDGDNRFRIIIRQKDSIDQRMDILESSIKNQVKPKGKLSRKSVLQYVSPSINITKLVKVKTTRIEKDILKLDELRLCYQYKIGLLYCKAGQTTEEEYFGNEHGSPAFTKFMEVLGDTVELDGFQGFAAGLDTKNGNTTGKYGLNTRYGIYEITFHVSTFLPFIKEDPQQIQRKRHIGNDIVCIVFMDGKGTFDPTAIKSHFLHSYIVVSEHGTNSNGEISYKVSTASIADVPMYGPGLPEPPVFTDRTELRNFLFAKAINGENACYRAPRFSKLSSRTRHALIDDIVNTYLKSNGTAPEGSDNNEDGAEEEGGLTKGKYKSDFNMFKRARRRSSLKSADEIDRTSKASSQLKMKAQNFLASIRKKSVGSESSTDLSNSELDIARNLSTSMGQLPKNN